MVSFCDEFEIDSHVKMSINQSCISPSELVFCPGTEHVAKMFQVHV